MERNNPLVLLTSLEPILYHMSETSPSRTEARREIKKASQIKYSHNYNLELSRLLGTFAFFYSNNRLYRALWNFYQAILHIEKDPSRRAFIVGGKVDEAQWVKFCNTAADFKRLYGITPGEENVICSYLDLKPRERPDMERHIVTIP